MAIIKIANTNKIIIITTGTATAMATVLEF